MQSTVHMRPGPGSATARDVAGSAFFSAFSFSGWKEKGLASFGCLLQCLPAYLGCLGLVIVSASHGIPEEMHI